MPHYIMDTKPVPSTGGSATKSSVGLGSVDNTSDANKPVSTAQQTALNLKASITQLPIVRRIDNSLISAPIKIKHYTVTSDASSMWTASIGSDFTEVLDVSVRAFGVDNTIAGIRQATLNAYTSASTSVGGVTFGNTLINTALVTAGVNSLSLVPSTVVRITIIGVGS